MNTNDDLTTKTDKQLADLQGMRHPNDMLHILAEKEWQRRLMKEQYDLNIKLLDKQLKLGKLSAIIGFIAIILGAIIGAALTILGPTILSILSTAKP